MNWLHYLLEANIYLSVFYAVYCLFLNKETHYTLNRVYLLLSSIIAFVLPVIQVGALKPAAGYAQQAYVTIAPAASKVTNLQVANHKPAVTGLTLQDVIWYVYLAGIVVLSVILVIKIVRLVKMTANAKTIANDNYKIVGINDSNTAFSFFNYLFIGTKTAGSHLIIQHELVHIRQKHSADIIFMELLRIINWFNPIIYLIQVSLKTVHEYIADEQTATHETNVLTYSSFLVDNAYGLNGSSITHSFFNYNLLKKRIIMLNQKRSGNLARLKYLVAVPVCAGMLCASTLSFSKNYALVDLAPRHDKQALAAKVLTTVQKAKPQKSNPHSPDAMADQKVPNIPAAPVGINDATKLPPPPPAAPPVSMQADTPIRTTTDVFCKYIARNVRYPAIDRDKKIGGRVIAAFDVVDGKITDPQIVRSVEPVMDGEVLRAIKAYDGTLDLKNGHYSIPALFQVVDYKGSNQVVVSHLPEANTAGKPIKQPAGFSTAVSLEEVVVVAYPSQTK